MTYVVTDECIKCRYGDCIDICPMSCFHKGELMVVINPRTCIDCGLCEPECPIGAIKPESRELLPWIERAAKFVQEWPNVTQNLSPLPNADLYRDEKNKFEKYMEN